MVVMWCNSCGALMGMREPLTDWSTEKGICAACLKCADVPGPPDEAPQEPPKEEQAE